MRIVSNGLLWDTTFFLDYPKMITCKDDMNIITTNEEANKLTEVSQPKPKIFILAFNQE